MENNIKLATVTELQPRSTVDLTNPPERLTDAQLAQVEAMAAEPLPALPTCDERHLAQCLRVMLAVLPRQQTDDLGGELFVRAYERHLGEYPNEAISYLADRATGECKWFPTIAECKTILGDWRRNDEALHKRNLARSIAQRERRARFDEARPSAPARNPITQEDIDGLSAFNRAMWLRLGFLVEDEDGNVRLA